MVFTLLDAGLFRYLDKSTDVFMSFFALPASVSGPFPPPPTCFFSKKEEIKERRTTGKNLNIAMKVSLNQTVDQTLTSNLRHQVYNIAIPQDMKK